MTIKPCPFCGKPARLRGGHDLKDPFFYVECVDINCMANVAGCKTPDKAVELWNRRAYESIGTQADA